MDQDEIDEAELAAHVAMVNKQLNRVFYDSDWRERVTCTCHCADDGEGPLLERDKYCGVGTHGDGLSMRYAIGVLAGKVTRMERELKIYKERDLQAARDKAGANVAVNLGKLAQAKAAEGVDMRLDARVKLAGAGMSDGERERLERWAAMVKEMVGGDQALISAEAEQRAGEGGNDE